MQIIEGGEPYQRVRVILYETCLRPIIWTSLSLRMAANIKPLSLPPKGVFHSFDALFSSLQEYGILAGCAYITKKSEQRDRRWIKTIACKRSGKEHPRIDNKEY
jgi:hypothetical protein